MSIFGAATGSSLGSTSGNRHSIEFKAGRMNLVDSDQDGVKKKMVHPDQRSVRRDDCAKIFTATTNI